MTRHFITLAKLAANAGLSALILPLLLAALIFQLNPELPPSASDLAALWLILFLGYGLPLVIIFPLLVAVVRFFATRELKLRWFHLKSTVWFLVAAVGVAICLYSLNHRISRDLLSVRDKQTMMASLSIMFVCWMAATIMASVSQVKGGGEMDRRRLVALLLLAAGVPASCLSWALAAGPPAPQAAGPPVELQVERKVLLLGFEGATFSRILPLVSEGRLPALGALLKSGAAGPMATTMPCRWSSAWASLSTGVLPARHGIGESRRYSLPGLSGEIRRMPTGLFMRQWLPGFLLGHRRVEAGDLRSAPIWKMVDRMRIDSAFVGWPLAGERPVGQEAERAERTRRAHRIHSRLLDRREGGPRPEIEGDLLRAVIADLEVFDATMRLVRGGSPTLLAAYFPGLGLAGARFEASGQGEEEFGGIGEEPRLRYAQVLGRYYEQIDQWVSALQQAIPPGTTTLIVSAYGTEGLGDIPRFARALAGLETPIGVHDEGPAGVLLVSGPGVSGGRHVDDLHVTDVVPLTLYLLGLPVGRDMDGRLPRRLFPRRSLNARPITFISSYGP